MKTVQSGRSHELALTFENIRDGTLRPTKISRGIGRELIEPKGLRWLDDSPVAFILSNLVVGQFPVSSNRPLEDGSHEPHPETLMYDHEYLGEGSVFYPVTCDGVLDLLNSDGEVDTYRVVITRVISDVVAELAPEGQKQEQARQIQPPAA